MTIQIVDVINDPLSLPDWFQTVTIVLFAIGFPIALLLAWAYEVTPEGIKADSAVQATQTVVQSTDRKLIYAILGLVVLVAGFQLSDQFLSGNATTATRSAESDSQVASNSPGSGVLRLQLALGQDLPASITTRLRTLMDLSPDGQQLAYIEFVDGPDLIYLKDLASGAERLLGAVQTFAPTFSNDGQRIAVPDGFGLNLLSTTGSLSPLMTGGFGRAYGYRGDWLDEQTFIHSNDLGNLSLFNIQTGQDAAVPRLEMEYGATNYFTPVVLPGREAMLIVATGATFGQPGLLIHNMTTAETRTLVNNAVAPAYAESGHIVFIRDGDIWAVPFDPVTQQLVGAEARIVENISGSDELYHYAYGLSDSGRLIYLEAEEEAPLSGYSYFWIDRAGQETVLELPLANINNAQISPDGRSLLVEYIGGAQERDIWLYDLQRGTFGRRTFSSLTASATWSRDGESFFFASAFAATDSSASIYRMNTDGTGDAELVFNVPAASLGGLPQATTPTGELLILQGSGPPLQVHSLRYTDGQWLSSQLMDEPYIVSHIRISPDGRWLSYTSDESGRDEVYVRPWPDIESGKWAISNNGGADLQWNPATNELFFLQRSDSTLISVRYSVEEESFIPELPTALLSGFDFPPRSPFSDYAVSPEGEKFVMKRLISEGSTAQQTSGPAVLTVVENWFEELNRLAPPDPQ